MPRLTASQISLMKQFFAQIGAVDASWILGDIPVDQIGGAGSWFTESFDTRLAVMSPTIITDQATTAQATADSALAAIAALTFISGQVLHTSNQTISAASPNYDDITLLTTDFDLDAEKTFMFSVVVGAELDAGEILRVFLDVDGATETCYIDVYSAGAARQQATQLWRVTLAAGTHTVKAKARTAAGSPVIYANSSSMSWWQV